MITSGEHPSLVGPPRVPANATHPLLVGRVTPAANGANGANGAPRSEPQGDTPVRGRRGYNKLFASLLTSSRWVESSSDEKAVLIALLALKDADGFVAASIPGLAHAAQVSIEVTQKMIDKLKSPDPFSRSQRCEGRTLEQIEGGFRFLNHREYRDWKERVRTEIEREIVASTSTSTSTDSETFSGRITYEKPLNPTTKHPTKQALDSWHPQELAAFCSLRGDGERGTFIIARRFAELAARRGEPDFTLAISYIAKDLRVSIQRAGKLRASIVQKGFIEEARPYSKEENKSARYRWALKTTLPIPPMPSSGQDDPDEELPF